MEYLECADQDSLMGSAVLTYLLIVLNTGLTIQRVERVRESFMEVDRGFPFGQHLSFEDFLVDLTEVYGNKEHELLNDFESSEQDWPIDDWGYITEKDYEYEGPARLEMGDEREEVQHKDDKFYGNSENGSDKIFK